MRALTIGIDLDGTLVDLMPSWLDWYNAHLAGDDETLALEDVTRDLHLCCSAGRKVYDALDIPGWYRSLPEIPGGADAVKSLMDAGHEIYICTSAGRSPSAPGDKVAWMRRMMPFVPQERVIIASPKHLLRFNVFIDDSPAKVVKYKMTWPKARTMGISQPWNSEVPYDFRAHDYRDPATAWQRMVHKISEYAEESDRPVPSVA